MKKRIYSIICAALVLLAGCNDPDYLGGHFTEDGAGAKLELTSVIASTLTPSLAWKDGDTIAVTTGYTDTYSNNRFFQCQSDGKTFLSLSKYPVYIKGKTTLVGYYPVTGVQGEEPMISFNTNDQSTLTDYLFAKTEVSPSNGQVHLTFDHALAQLQATIVTLPEEQITGYRISGLYQQATANPYTLDLTLAEAPEDYVSTPSASITGFVLNLLPQTIAADAAVPATITLTGTIRSYSLSLGELTLQPGKALALTIDLTKDGAGTIEYTDRSADWIDSGLGGDIISE